MVWTKLDDNFPDHPKIAELSNSAYRLFVDTLCYCGKYLTDGQISEMIANRYGATDDARSLLVANLWEKTDTGYRVLDYLDYQPSKVEVREKKEASRLRMVKSRALRATNGATSDATSREVRAPRPDPTHIKNSLSEQNSDLEKDALELCQLLATRMVANEYKAPDITGKWIKDMTYMMRIDGRTKEQIAGAINWCQADSFWCANIKSPSKLRAQYDTLRLKAKASVSRRSETPDVPHKEIIDKNSGEHYCQSCGHTWPCLTISRQGQVQF